MKTSFEKTTHITKEGTPLICRYLTPNDIEGVIKLQDIVSENLKIEGTPRHIVKRSPDHFLKHLSEPHTMFGITDLKGNIIAQSIFRISDISTGEELCIDTLPGLEEGNKLSVIQGMIVHPAYEKLKLMPLMLDQWFEWCEERGVHHLAARTQSIHTVSSEGFIKSGFNNVAVIVDPQDNAEVNILHKNTLEL